jgi:hypothetical protein
MVFWIVMMPVRMTPKKVNRGSVDVGTRMTAIMTAFRIARAIAITT